MLVRSERLGDLQISDDKVLAFPTGLLGFSDDTRFVLVEIDDSESYRWLQSVDDPTLSFLTVVPWHFFPDYEPEIDELTQQELGLKKAEDAIVLCILTVREGTPTEVTANLLGPLIINTVSRAGRQIVLAESGHSVRAALVAS